MSLIIAWRNPLPPARAERKVRRVVEDRFDARIFRAPSGGRTKSDDLRRDVVEASSMLASSTTQEENGDGVVWGCVAGKQCQESADPCA